MKDQRRFNKQLFEIDLTKDPQGYGFSIRGGTELDLPIFVLRMAEGGAAHRDGRLKVRTASFKVKTSCKFSLLLNFHCFVRHLSFLPLLSLCHEN